MSLPAGLEETAATGRVRASYTAAVAYSGSTLLREPHFLYTGRRAILHTRIPPMHYYPAASAPFTVDGRAREGGAMLYSMSLDPER
jgi:hypothetical protein